MSLKFWKNLISAKRTGNSSARLWKAPNRKYSAYSNWSKVTARTANGSRSSSTQSYTSDSLTYAWLI